MTKGGLIEIARAASFAAEVGPEFLGHVADGVEHDVGAPDAKGVAEVALILRQVGVGEAGGDAVAEDFGIVELNGAAIAACDEDAAEGIDGAAPGAAGAELEVTRILFEYRGEDGSSHQGADAGVGIERGVALGVTGKLLTIRRIGIAGLAHEGECAEERDGDRVGHGLFGEPKFNFCGERLNFLVAFDAQVVGHDPEKAIIGRSDAGLDRRGRLDAGAFLEGDRLRQGRFGERGGQRWRGLLGAKRENAGKGGRDEEVEKRANGQLGSASCQGRLHQRMVSARDAERNWHEVQICGRERQWPGYWPGGGRRSLWFGNGGLPGGASKGSAWAKWSDAGYRQK